MFCYGTTGRNLANHDRVAARIVAGNVLLFVAVLPFTILAALFVDAVYACTAVGFVYGFLASLESAMLNYYPTKAVLILTDPQCGVGYDFVHYSKLSASITLVVVLLISGILFALLMPQRHFAFLKEGAENSGKMINRR